MRKEEQGREAPPVSEGNTKKAKLAKTTGKTSNSANRQKGG